MSITPEQLAASGTEHGNQAAIFCWSALPEVRTKYPVLKYLFAVPNGFYGSAAQKGKMKAEGLKSGVPDIWLPVAKTRQIPIGVDPPFFIHEHLSVTAYGWKEQLNGLVIELKIGKNVASPEQLDWLAFLKQQGYRVWVCYGWEEARDKIVEYLEG